LTQHKDFPHVYVSSIQNTIHKTLRYLVKKVGVKAGTSTLGFAFSVVVCIVLNCVFLFIFVDSVVLCIVCLYMCTLLLPPGVYPIAVKYIISYQKMLPRGRISWGLPWFSSVYIYKCTTTTFN